MRSTCMYCEQKGKETQLVRIGHWGVCPVCSPGYLAAVRPPTFAEVLAREGVAPCVTRETDRRERLAEFRRQQEVTNAG